MITTNIELVADALKSNKLVAIPTETVYGLAANALNAEAVANIFALKGRPHFNPLIAHLKSLNEVDNVAHSVPQSAIRLAERFWPGPLTLLLRKKEIIPDIITAGRQTVAVRVPSHPIALELLNKLNFPLAAPSANPYTSISPTTAQHVHSYFGEKLEFILDGGACNVGIESTIIGFEGESPVLYRMGSIQPEEISETCKLPLLNKTESTNIEAPGMVLKHYSPKTLSIVSDDIEQSLHELKNKRVGLLLYTKTQEIPHDGPIEYLCSAGDMNEAARNLYAALHRLDHSHVEIILMQRLPNFGIGNSINDKLNRASYKK